MKRPLYNHAILIICLIFMGCGSPTSVTQQASSFDSSIVFSPFPPVELDSNATPAQLVSFAWNEFLALNWKSSYSKNNKRDYPDTSWSYSSDKLPFPDLVVWETYAHRSELRPYSDKMLPFDNPPHYSFGDQLYPQNAQTSFKLFHNLDENNEIGSCDVFAHVNKYQQQYQVLYQAKVNRQEYQYIYDNYPTKARLLAATTHTTRLIQDSVAAYYGTGAPCDCPPGKNILCLPCGGSQGAGPGSIEIKTAWRRLTTEDDPSRFFTRTVITYSLRGDSIIYVNDTYGLIGLHIIHKTRNYPAFVFATFEQVDVEDANMGLVTLNSKGNDSGPLQTYKRLHPITDIANESTKYVHDQLKKRNPKSIWQYYRLTGVQGKPTKDSSSLNYFLANYVIESDSTLANFHGGGIGTPFNDSTNLLYQGKRITMGGCQGCHGVAQLHASGDFSFLLDTVGKPVYRPDIGLTSSKLQLYIKAFRAFSTAHKGSTK
ncbi:hypothetical protein [Chitinophaga sancti]|uniref:hypothetical protein n=1 Tax=Chitinophaga sancti TaxID=1004 RepID=UPI003F7A2F51